MSLFDAFEPITRLLPEVAKPERVNPLATRLAWAAACLVLFFILGHVYPLGVDQTRLVGFERYELLLGSKTGTLNSVGIGPIVLASIFLQLAIGAGLLRMDARDPEQKRKFQGTQKLFAIVLAIVQSGIYVFSGFVPPDLQAPLFGSLLVAQLVITLQLSFGSVLLIYLDEVVQRYGISSGISLFIAAGVAQAIVSGSLSFLPVSGTEIPGGLIPQALYYLTQGDLVTSVWTIMPIVFTILVFLAVVYVEGMKIELPLAYGMARGMGARYPIKFLYVSNLPVILASAVLLNIQLMGMFMANAGFPLMGAYASNQPVPGVSLAYLTSSPANPLAFTGGYPAYLQYMGQPVEILHALVYGVALIVLCIVFGWFWIESTGLGPRNVAEQLARTGMQIPGYRADPRVIEKILERYIPVITVLGSAFVGFLAWIADLTGALGTGTGILLAVGILYRLYEELAQQQLFELYPQLRNLVG